MSLVALLLALPIVANPQVGSPQEPAGSVERPGHGQPVCGLGKAFHSGRRAALREKVGEGVMLFRGLPDTRGYVAFRQDKTFWYLTGIETPNAALVMDAGTGREVLFLPKPNPRKEGWEGEMWDSGDEWVRELAGFEEVRESSELLPVLREMLGDRKSIAISRHPWVALGGCYDRAGPDDRRREEDPLDGRTSREEALAESLKAELGVDEVLDVGPAIVDLRLVKQPEEIEAMRRAGLAGARAMVEAMRSTNPGVGEWELEALMSFVQICQGAAGPAYHAIVGSGGNSCVLHYSVNTRRVGPGEVVLLDYGPELDHYTTDITRTWPAGGTFSERQAELYDAVLAAQKAGIEAVAPGGTIREIDAACTKVLKERGFGDLIRHGACHWIGMEVHDPGDYARTFEPGMAFTVEPGLYEESTGIGIRIEDVVVVTKDGCEVLSDAAPKERAEVEKTVRARGLLDPDGSTD